MSVMKKANALVAPGKNFCEKLYIVLSKIDFDSRDGYRVTDLGEGMSVVEQVIWGWWKQRYVIDHVKCCAYEFIDGNTYFSSFTTEDVDWSTLGELPEKAQMRAEEMSAQFPTFIHGFQNGVAEVSWQLNPDGRYFMDDEGFGMTLDEEITVYGFVDAELNVLVKFSYIEEDWERLSEMRREAENIVKSKMAE